MKKQLVIVGLLTTFVLVLSACTTPAQPTEPAGPAAAEPVKLKFMCWSATIGTVETVEDELTKPFTEKTGIEMEVEITPWSEYWTKIQTLAASGTMPDVYCQSVAFAWDHANRGISLNVQPLFDADMAAEDYFLELTPVLRYPDGAGDMYAVPFRWVDGVLFYNKDLFDEGGVAYPTDEWTYDDVLEAAKQLTKDTDGDGKIDQWGFYASNDHIALDALIKANGGLVLSEDYSQCMLTDQVAVDAIQWMVDAIDEWGVSPAPGLVGAELGAGEPAQLAFATGRVAMVIHGSYSVAFFQDMPFNWDVSYQPIGDVKRVVYGGPDSLSLAATSEHPNEAWEFLKYFIGPEMQAKATVVGLGSMPFLKEAAYNDVFLGTPGLPENYKVAVDSFPYIIGADFGSQWIEWRVTVMNSELQSALLGERSAADSAASACESIDAILATIQ